MADLLACGEFLNPRATFGGEEKKTASKWPLKIERGIVELFTLFVGNTLCGEARVVEDEKIGSLPAPVGPAQVKVGTMIVVRNKDHNEEKKVCAGNREWFLAVVEEFWAEDPEWMQVHLWRSYGRLGDHPDRIYQPVWVCPSTQVETYASSPHAGGLPKAEKWTQWLSPRGVATMALAEGVKTGKGFKVTGWEEDFVFVD